MLAGLGPYVGGQPVEGRRDRVLVAGGVRGVGAQDAQPGAGDRREHVLLDALGGGLGDELVLAVAEEGEVVLGEPAQQLLRLGDLLLLQPLGRRGGQLARDEQRAVVHLGPVLDRLADVGQHAAQVRGDLLQIGAVGLAVDLDMDPGLHERVVRQFALGGAAGAQDFEELAGEIAPDHDLRVDHHMDGPVLPGQLIGDRVHQERHVVGDHLDDRVAARPPVLLDGGRVHPYVRRALRAQLGQPVVRQRRPEHVHRVPRDQVLRRAVEVVALKERS